jgi:hypothetical protein
MTSDAACCALLIPLVKIPYQMHLDSLHTVGNVECSMFVEFIPLWYIVRKTDMLIAVSHNKFY